MNFDYAVELSEKITSKRRSPRTLTDYRRAIKLLENHTPQEYRSLSAFKKGTPISKSRYRLLKAAYQFGCAERLLSYLKQAEELSNAGDFAYGNALKAKAYIESARLLKQAPDYERQRFRQKLGAAHPAVATEISSKKHSKRRFVGKLNKEFPDREWQFKILEELPDHHTFSYTLLALTGLRPSELQNGVSLKNIDGFLHVKIEGAKITNFAGQPWREMVFNPKQDEFAYMVYESVQAAGGSDIWLQPYSQQALRKSHSKAVEKALGSKWKNKVSLYTHRHALSADLKAAGYNPEKIALAMGHSSDRSQAYYGMAKQATGHTGRGLVEVKAARKVKLNEPVGQRMTRTSLSFDSGNGR
ncbi:tyrosine-type recombinase/integrase [Maridesulfovibrio salexigens]|uniref:Tyr recombinase domain-containing protein n=1 Tax=Maridesulfovibrio salexigens (strain ATCC 14822 / DSM 2638 / NCIMB 8403 / VKM B-1763) TaxID=526222 RepID=C6BZF3_MARSD|nr:tyrosine-type recombinase/integrase [Maridesulfovibrio salexigens]ACS80790.1 hypothetical protein Desal_2736 [Maridesulfovibrio salexigens DSM 2638]